MDIPTWRHVYGQKTHFHTHKTHFHKTSQLMVFCLKCEVKFREPNKWSYTFTSVKTFRLKY